MVMYSKVKNIFMYVDYLNIKNTIKEQLLVSICVILSFKAMPSSSAMTLEIF